jgi:multiple sugar transport system ATP-binding protein
MRMAEVSLERVDKSFDNQVAVAGLDLHIADGEFVVLLGPTGAGKTTTLRLVAGLERADSGRIRIGNVDVTTREPAARDVALVFQQYSLYPHLSVFDNLAFPLRAPVRRIQKTDIKQRVCDVAEMLHIEHKLANKATQLSGGEMQRVAIGRALVREPQIYLMDEPLSSLDAKLRAELRLELKRIQEELGSTLLYVTHDQLEAMTMADRIGVIDQGRLIQIDTPRQMYEDPDNVYVASRLGQPAVNLLPAAEFPLPATPADAATIGIRTEHIRIANVGKGEYTGRVDWIEHLGDQDHLHVVLGEHRLVTLVDPDSHLRSGDEVNLEFQHPLFFNHEGQRVRN